MTNEQCKTCGHVRIKRDCRATKRPKIKRLDLPYHLYFHGIDRHKYDAAIDASMEVLSDVPVFARDGWFLWRDGQGMRSWFQINGKPYAQRTKKKFGKSIQVSQQSMIDQFKSALIDQSKWETELGREATDLLSRSMWTIRKTPEAIYLFIYEQRSLQHIREDVRNMKRRMRAFREQGKAK